MPHSYTQLLYHIVYSTKERRPQLTPAITDRLYPYLGGAVRDEGGTALAIGGVADHMHILTRLRQDKSLSAVVGAIKANASGWIHREFADANTFAWQEGFAAFTVSKSQSPKVSDYIANQGEHHRRRSYQEELIALLDAHEIEYDPRYLWA
jgi:REP element-mobilizing transposase RayT